MMGCARSSALTAALLLCVVENRVGSFRPLARHRSNRRHRSSCAAVFEDDECEDLCLNVEDPSQKTVEVEKAPMPRRVRRALWWSGSEPEKCGACGGSGEQVCRFCHGTGFLSAVGGNEDALLYEGIGKECPVCEDGVEPCSTCAGTGYVLKGNKQVIARGNLHP